LTLALGVGWAAVPAQSFAKPGAADPALPDPRLTPGAVAETRTAAFCVRGLCPDEGRLCEGLGRAVAGEDAVRLLVAEIFSHAPDCPLLPLPHSVRNRFRVGR